MLRSSIQQIGSLVKIKVALEKESLKKFKFFSVTLCTHYVTHTFVCEIANAFVIFILYFVTALFETTITRRQYLDVFFNHLEPNQLCICVYAMHVRTLCVRG